MRHTCGGSTCHNDGPTLRCARCKVQRYCSRACQAEAWPAHRTACGHMVMATTWQALEAAWWTQLPVAVRQALEADGLTITSMAFFGEVYFVLAGLKPCVVLTGVPTPWKEHFLEHVVRPSGVLGAPNVRLASSGSVHTHAFDLSNHVVLLHTMHPMYAEAASLLHVDMPLAASVMVTESQVARILDYPVGLDECAVGTMLEVAYFSNDTLLTTFCALDTPRHRRLINVHFQRYQSALGSMLPLRIEAVVVSS
ncbi:hypothetical protein SPRG_14328 [Saprolegnia parasitica CBS 223.65]|uniref:MYND-type domain-containing protein n=1 Tax=Saprolegnia parasitica (strain CBS 223.65) TaxID=695850 RepID=A0A067C1L5_SAPPC|nr:hypothetical protein SPRG_14328 [Saprolegnia parasitica CBS 223.65]KDO20456.1 hypothetical protein SPRG_14328 [Saprolegnia parasitica CBS 223.65]|eukprot:XP_012208846.1 hypothetical protein SPRG_14328 [Saprolegnia parasitica CBS 223.65]